MKRLATSLAGVAALTLVSCTSVHEIQTLGPNSYMVSGRNCGGMFVNYPAFKARVKAAADKFAARQGKCAVQTEDWERNRWIPGLPYYEYKFELVSP